MSKVGRVAIPLIAAAVCLVVVAWLDARVLRDVQQEQARTFQVWQLNVIWPLVEVALAGAILLLALVAWRSQSAVVGVVYLMVGGFIAFLLDITFSVAASVNGAPPLIPEPLSLWIGNLYFYSDGPTHAVTAVGGGMLLIGLAVTGAWVVGRRRSTSSADGPARPTT